MAAQTVIGFFDDQQEALRAIEQLQSRGIGRDRIDVSRGSTGTTEVSSEHSDHDRHSGIGGFFRNLFSDDDDQADRYSKVASSSNAIVTVHAQSREEAEAAADILDDCGAVDVDERASQYGFTNTRSAETLSERQNIASDRDTTIERIEENLEVGKRTVEQGGVRVRSRIVERPVEEHIRLREEHVSVQRQAVDRPVSGDELTNFREQDIELTERREVPVVNKEARVVEEISLSKDVTERDETINETLRNTEVDINKVDRNSNRNTDSDFNGPRSI
jgi:stress response protein YsnF